MTDTKETNKPQEIDVADLDQVVGGAARGIVVHDARKQEQSDKLNGEHVEK